MVNDYKSMLLNADKASLPDMEEIQINPKERKADKLRKIVNYSKGTKIWKICDTVVLVNCVGNMTPEEIMDEYILSHSRISY